jgi:hypothetical protein
MNQAIDRHKWTQKGKIEQIFESTFIMRGDGVNVKVNAKIVINRNH